VRARSPAADSPSATPQVPGLQPPTNRFFISEGIRKRRCQVSGFRCQVKDTPSSTRQASRARA